MWIIGSIATKTTLRTETFHTLFNLSEELFSYFAGICIVAWAMTQPTRKLARQATSAVAHIAPEPEEDDPLLALALTGRLRFRSDSAPFIHSHPRRN